MTPDHFGIVANLKAGSKHVRPGALCWVCRNPQDGNIRVRVLSRGGRWITCFVAGWKLGDFRAKWLPPAKAKFRDELDYLTKSAAAADAARFDADARGERMRRNVCEIERMAGQMDEHGRRK